MQLYNCTVTKLFGSRRKPSSHKLVIRLLIKAWNIVCSQTKWLNGTIRKEHLLLSSGSLPPLKRRGAFPPLRICPDYTPLFSNVFLPLPLLFLGVTQEGVYRTVGSNIQVQKLLNAFFGKEARL